MSAAGNPNAGDVLIRAQVLDELHEILERINPADLNAVQAAGLVAVLRSVTPPHLDSELFPGAGKKARLSIVGGGHSGR